MEPTQKCLIFHSGNYKPEHELTFSDIGQLRLRLFPSAISAPIADKVDAFSGGEDLQRIQRLAFIFSLRFLVWSAN
jgi:hypothetical protein